MIEIQLNDRVVKVQPEITIEQFQRLQNKEEIYKTSPPDLLSLFLNVPVNELLTQKDNVTVLALAVPQAKSAILYPSIF